MSASAAEVLAYIETTGCSISQAAGRFGVSAGTIKSWRHRYKTAQGALDHGATNTPAGNRPAVAVPVAQPGPVATTPRVVVDPRDKRAAGGTKCTPELTARFAELIAGGNFIETACAACRISPQTYRNWLERGRKEIERLEAAGDEGATADEFELRFVGFYVAVAEATVKAETDAVEAVRGSMASDWRAAAWWLERGRVDRWSKRTETRLTGPDGGAVEVEAKVDLEALRAMTPEQLRALAYGEGGTLAPGGI